MNILFFLTPKSQVAYLQEDWTVRQGLEKLRAHRYSAIPVINREGVYCGTITDSDFLWKIMDSGKANICELEDDPLKELIRPKFNPAVRVTASMDQLLAQIMQQNFVPVVDDRNVFIGIITRKDVIHYLLDRLNSGDDLEK